MLTGNKRIVLADIESNQNKMTGDRIKSVTGAKVLVAQVELVGINTAQIGQVQGFNLLYSVTVKRIQYDKQKFLFFDGALYEVKTMSKAKHPADMLLNVQVSNDNSAKSAIEEWMASANL